MSVTPDNNVSKPSRRLINAFRSDMFGRTKISEPFTLLDSTHRYNISNDYSFITEGGGNVSYNAFQSSVFLEVGTATGDKVVQESKRIMPYQPGKSLQTMQSITFSSPQNNLRQRAGYFGRFDGVYFELDGNEAYFVQRSTASGSTLETRVPQSSWNVDKLDGTGPSDLILDVSKAQILFSEYEWLGVGSVRIGFIIDGEFVIAHQFNHANHATGVYMTTASLPVRYEIENLDVTAQSSSLQQTCTTVISNGGYQKATEDWTAVRTDSPNFDDDFFPLVSIRINSEKIDSVIIPSSVTVLPVAQGNYEFALIRNATITGGTWVEHQSTGNVEYNVSATSMSGGEEPVVEGFTSSTNQSAGFVRLGTPDVLRFDLQLGRTASDLPTPDPVSGTMTLALRSLGGTQSAVGSMSWVDLL